MRNRQFIIPLTLATSITAAPVAAIEFETHRIQGLLNLDLSYGVTYRLDDPDERLIAFANGGDGPNVNGDDGELNYNTGLVSNMVRGTAELIVAFENVGLYARGAAYQDWVQDERLDRTSLSSDGEQLVGSDATLLDHYLTTTVTVAGTPVHFRLGDQVINWSATSFLRDGLDLINPLDLGRDSSPRVRRSIGANHKGCCGPRRASPKSSPSKAITNTSGKRWYCRRWVRISARSIFSAAMV